MRTVLRNLIWMLLSQMFTWALSIVLLIAAPRALGSAAYGRLEFATTFVAFFGLVASLGTRTYLVKAIARDNSQLNQLVFNALLFNLICSLVLAAASIGLSIGLGYQRSVVALIAVSAIGMTFLTLDIPASSGFQGLQEMRGLAVVAAVQEIVLVGLGLLALWRGWGIAWVAAAFAASYFVQFIANALRIRPKLRGATPRPALWWSIARGGLPFFFSTAAIVLYGTIDIPLLQYFAGDADVGIYSIAYKWVGLPAFFASIVMTSVLPSLSARGIAPTAEFTQQANKAIRLVFLVAAPIATGIGLISADVLRVVYSGELQRGVPVMRILALHLPAVALTMILGTVLIAADKQRAWLVIGLVAAVCNIATNLFVIPWSVHQFNNGAIGAAIVTVGTEALIVAGGIWLKPQGVLDRQCLRFCFLVTIACACMVGAVLTIGDVFVGVRIALGAAVFGLTSLLLGVVTRSEITQAFGEVRNTLRRSG